METRREYDAMKKWGNGIRGGVIQRSTGPSQTKANLSWTSMIQKRSWYQNRGNWEKQEFVIWCLLSLAVHRRDRPRKRANVIASEEEKRRRRRMSDVGI